MLDAPIALRKFMSRVAWPRKPYFFFSSLYARTWMHFPNMASLPNFPHPAAGANNGKACATMAKLVAAHGGIAMRSLDVLAPENCAVYNPKVAGARWDDRSKASGEERESETCKRHAAGI